MTSAQKKAHDPVEECDRVDAWHPNGNIQYVRNAYGSEEWHEYDENHNCIHSLHIQGNGMTEAGQESWRTFDNQGNMTHIRDADGHQTWITYDRSDDENMYPFINVYYRNTDGHQWSKRANANDIIHGWVVA